MVNTFGVSMRVVNFRQELRRAALEAEEIADEDLDAKLRFANNLLRRITPVDTGFARSRWKYSSNLFLPGGVLENDAPYIIYLNQGSSKQAPAFFIERALQASKIL